MSQTPIKVPPSATAYTPATQDADLRSQINSLLYKEGYVTKIQDTLLHSLDAHPSNWPSAVQSHALTLLRTGEVTTFPALVRRVLEDVRHDTAAANAGSEPSSGNGKANGETNGASSGGSSTNGNGNKNGSASDGGGGGGGSLALPEAVVDAVLKVTRDCLDAVCEVDDGSAAG
ncbi:hypothetical protein F4818DRAFT_439035 [Hypoxylon cercidicola]|nr:hypothetical protein F4818DRAFT_439035 [Hypoxylon cercidicola]